MAVLRHGKVYLKISAPWSDASPNLPKSRFVARRKAKPSQFSAPALTPMPMPFPGPDYQALTIVRIRAAVTAAALRRRRPYTRRILLGTPVDKRFVDFLRARIGKTIGIGLMLNGRLMERTVRAAVTRGLGGAVGRIN